MRDKVLLILRILIIALVVVLLWLGLLPFVLQGTRFQGLNAMILLICITLLGVVIALSEWLYYERQKRKEKDV